MTLALFFSKRKTELPKAGQDEILFFYKMLLKMRKRHPKLNVDKIMKKLYPEFKLVENDCNNIFMIQ
jgi:hypothetical protein